MIKKRLQNIMGRRLVTGTVENLRPNEILIKEDNGRAGLFTFINGGVVDITKA
jgi:F0F1-type ATP synthase epsilon subunit